MTGESDPREEGRKRLEEAREQMYRDLVLDCAERLFSEGRFEQVTMRDVATEAGISPRTLYAVFPSKQEVFEAVVRRRGSTLVETLKNGVGGEGPVLDRLRTGLRDVVAFFIDHRLFFRILLRESRSWGILPAGDGRAHWRLGHTVQARLVQDGIDQGVFQDGDVELMAATCIAIAQVHLAAAMELPGEPDVDRISAEIFQQLTRSICRPEALAQISLE